MLNHQALALSQKKGKLLFITVQPKLPINVSPVKRYHQTFCWFFFSLCWQDNKPHPLTLQAEEWYLHIWNQQLCCYKESLEDHTIK